MIILEWTNLKYPSVTLSLVKIEIGTGQPATTFHPRLLRLGEFIMGNDDPENEHFIFPGRLSIDFMFPAAESVVNGVCLLSFSQAHNDYLTILDALQNNDAVITVYKEGEPEIFYTAAFNKEDSGLLSGSNPDRKISLMFLDDYTKLSEEIEINTAVFPALYPGGGTFDSLIRLGELVKTLFVESSRRSVVYSINNVQFLTQFRFRKVISTDPPVSEYCYLTNNEVGIRNFLFYHDSDTKSQPFKTLLQTLASYAIIGFNRSLKVLPLWYDGGPVTIISRSCIEAEDEIIYGKRFDGLTALCGYTDEKGTYKVENKDYGKVIRRPVNPNPGRQELSETYIKNDKDVFKMVVMFSIGGGDNNNGVSRMLRYINPLDGTTRTIKTDSVSYMKADGSWSEEKSLAEWSASLTWETYHNKALKYKATLPGINYSFYNAYQVEGLNGLFRPVYISYDFENDQTQIIIRENTAAGSYINPTSIYFNRILRSFDYIVTVKKKSGEISYQYSYTDGEFKSTSPDVPYISTEHVSVKIKNAYNCARTSAIEYDGIALSVASHDMKLWRDSWTYVVYIAIGKNKDTSAPASSYPVHNDLNAAWYLLTQLNDQQINDPDYYYEYFSKRIVTSSPFWLWVGLKSSSAPLFDNIPIYDR